MLFQKSKLYLLPQAELHPQADENELPKKSELFLKLKQIQVSTTRSLLSRLEILTNIIKSKVNL